MLDPPLYLALQMGEFIRWLTKIPAPAGTKIQCPINGAGTVFVWNLSLGMKWEVLRSIFRALNQGEDVLVERCRWVWAEGVRGMHRVAAITVSDRGRP